MSNCGCRFEVNKLSLDSPVSDSLLESLQLAKFGLHDVIESVEESRNRDHDGRLELAKIILKFLDVSLVEPNCDSIGSHADVHESFEHVSERQVGNVNIVLSDLELSVVELFKSSDVRHEVSVSEHHSLWHASGARSVGKGVKSVWPYISIFFEISIFVSQSGSFL